jgi:hypothetical protein
LPVAPGPLRVCYWNAEDPEDETERRFAAACIQYGVEPESLEGGLFLDHKFTPGRRLARTDAHGRIRVDPEVLEWVSNFIGEHAIDVLMCDPFVAFHRVPEIDNGAMEELIKTVIEPIAAKRNCCIELAQHTRKPSFGQRADITADDARGASAQINASRSVRVINRMTQEEALLPGISAEDRKLYIRVSRDKPTSPPPEKASWLHLIGVDLPNSIDGAPGDNIQVPVAWQYPDSLELTTPSDVYWVRDFCREKPRPVAPRSPDWLGYALIDGLHLARENEAHRAKSGKILARRRKEGVLKTAEIKTEQRKRQQVYVPGDWNEPAQRPDDEED